MDIELCCYWLAFGHSDPEIEYVWPYDEKGYSAHACLQCRTKMESKSRAAALLCK
jgi:hypothetical protein